jgi:hypothetical protein
VRQNLENAAEPLCQIFRAVAPKVESLGKADEWADDQASLRQLSAEKPVDFWSLHFEQAASSVPSMF